MSLRRRHLGRTVLCFAAAIAACPTTPAPAQTRPAATTTQAANQADELLTFTFPENVELRVLLAYVGDRLGIQFFYDDAIGQQRVTIRPGAKIPRSKLLDFLQLILQAKGYALADMEPGWKRIVANGMLTNVGRPTTAPATQQADAGVVTQVFTLAIVDATRMEAAVKPFLTQPGGAVLGIPEQRALVVTDYAFNMRRVADLVRLLDQQTRDIVVRFVPVRHGDAAEIAPKVTQVMQGKLNTAGFTNPAQGGAIEVGFDQRTNQVAIVGPKERVEEAAAVVGEFDAPGDMMTRTYQFEFASPDQVDKLMRQMLDPAVAKRTYQAGVDKDARLLVVTGTPQVHATIEAMKKSLDSAMARAASPIRFYKLSNATAAEVLDTIRSIQGEEPDDRGDQAYGRERSKGRANPLAGRGGKGGSYGSRATAEPSADGRPMAAANSPAPGAGTAAGLAAPASNPPTTTGSSAAVDSRPADHQSSGRGGGGFQTADATVTADPNTNSIIVVADPATQKVYEQLIQMLDKRRPQVLIECTIVTLDTSNDFRLGVEVGFNDISGSTETITFSSFGIGRPQVNASGSPTGRLALAPGLQGFNGAVLDSEIADVLVNALFTSGRARVVSAPRILVNDNATGSLLSTAEQPYADINIGNTVSTTSFGGYVEAGTSIELTPHISEADYLQLEYLVSLNRFSGEGANGIPPPRQTSALTSTVTVPDGSTIIIGGLNSSSVARNVRGVPILGQIPLLEYLFSSRTSTNNETTLFAFIRPVILRDDRFKDLQYLSQRDMRAAGVPADEPSSEPMIIE